MTHRVKVLFALIGVYFALIAASSFLDSLLYAKLVRWVDEREEPCP